ncbi:MAG: hypothetical protein O3A37_12400 [Planctomycetota bacterium]|nr:hypothetical protein [Planctomycetota bacterium]
MPPASRPGTSTCYRSSPAYQAHLQPQIRGMVEDYIALRQRFPHMEDTWQPGWPGTAA